LEKLELEKLHKSGKHQSRKPTRARILLLANDGKTDSVLDEVRAWQSRALEAVYPILYLDELKIKVKSQGRVVNKSIYPAFGVTLTGLKEILGISVVAE
jgi:hypothetical protein